MTSNLIFRAPGRTQTYMPVSVNASKEEIFQKYHRGSFSTINDWPHESPAAGCYDVKNSDTKLILLNNQKKYSHLRGKTKEKHEPFKKDQYYDWVEKEIEMKKQSSNESLNGGAKSPTRKPNPDRHLLRSGGCSYRNVEDRNFNQPSSEYLAFRQRNKSAVPTSSYKAFNSTLEKKEDEQLENEILLKYLYAVGKRTTGFQTARSYRRPPREYLSSYNLNHPNFNNGQRLFLNELCSMYSVTPLKQSKQQQYIKLFRKQTDGDQKHRAKYRMHGGDNFELYKNWLVSERPLPHEVNCGYQSLQSKSMITSKPVTNSSLSNASSFASQSSNIPKKTASDVQPATRVKSAVVAAARPMTSKKTKVVAKISSSSETSFTPREQSHRIESHEMIKKIKDFDEEKGLTKEPAKSSDENE